MKYQALFPLQNKSKIFKVSSAAIFAWSDIRVSIMLLFLSICSVGQAAKSKGREARYHLY